MYRPIFNHVPEQMKSCCQMVADNFEGKCSVDLIKRQNSDALEIQRDDDKYIISYHNEAQASRGIGAVLAGLVQNGQKYVEQGPFKKLGIMLDCSRNAVMKVEHIKRWLNQLSLMGYNLLMLYTEDTYELPGEPYFGYHRGRYSVGELKEIDAYAASLNIETVGCIQTLGHLSQLLQWDAYKKVKDTAAVLLVDEPETYVLIEKMIIQMSSCIRSRRIHIGMDETFDLGLGEFLRRNGYQNQKEIYNRHLDKVVEICKKHNLQPMIWSDMYFRTSMVPCENYDPNVVIPAEVKNAIPQEVEFVFWDYYKTDKKYYSDVIRRHRDLGKGPIVASGVWTWERFWYDNNSTLSTAGPCIDACRESNVEELIFTLWGDNGAYCEVDSAMAGLAWAAEKCFSPNGVDDNALGQRFRAITGRSYEDVVAASELNNICNVAAYMWDDPIFEGYWRYAQASDNEFGAKSLARCNMLMERIAPLKIDTEAIDFNHLYNIASFIQSRITLDFLLDEMGDFFEFEKTQKAIKICQELIGKLDILLASFRRQWYRRNKTNGFEVIQNRYGGLRQRILELSCRLSESQADGTTVNIPERRE